VTSLCHLVFSEWAILVPAYTIVLVLATYASYFALTLMGTPNFDSLSTIIGHLFISLYPHILIPSPDRYAHFPVPEKQENPYLAHRRSDAVPVPYDIPLGMVNRILYRRDSTDENLINQQS
jgi:phosphatidylinositol N-acetylglucosaminyltransferase subunit P